MLLNFKAVTGIGQTACLYDDCTIAHCESAEPRLHLQRIGRAFASGCNSFSLPARGKPGPDSPGRAPRAILTRAAPDPTLKAMEVRFSPEKEARLRLFASRTGKEATQLVEEAVDRLLEYDAGSVEAPEYRRMAAGCGGLLESDESFG